MLGVLCKNFVIVVEEETIGDNNGTDRFQVEEYGYDSLYNDNRSVGEFGWDDGVVVSWMILTTREIMVVLTTLRISYVSILISNTDPDVPI